MRKTLLLVLILLVSAGLAVAQQDSTSPSSSPSSPSSSSQASPGSQSTSPGMQSTSPGMQSTSPSTSSQSVSPSGGETSIEGCLGGSAGNFTVMDQSGTTYQLQLPPNADSSSLSKHTGEQVRVTGTISGAGTPTASSSASASGSSASATGGAGQSSISVSKIDKIGDTCSSGATSPKTGSK